MFVMGIKQDHVGKVLNTAPDAWDVMIIVLIQVR